MSADKRSFEGGPTSEFIQIPRIDNLQTPKSHENGEILTQNNFKNQSLKNYQTCGKDCQLLRVNNRFLSERIAKMEERMGRIEQLVETDIKERSVSAGGTEENRRYKSGGSPIRATSIANQLQKVNSSGSKKERVVDSGIKDIVRLESEFVIVQRQKTPKKPTFDVGILSAAVTAVKQTQTENAKILKIDKIIQTQTSFLENFSQSKKPTVQVKKSILDFAIFNRIKQGQGPSSPNSPTDRVPTYESYIDRAVKELDLSRQETQQFLKEESIKLSKVLKTTRNYNISPSFNTVTQKKPKRQVFEAVKANLLIMQKVTSKRLETSLLSPINKSSIKREFVVSDKGVILKSVKRTTGHLVTAPSDNLAFKKDPKRHSISKPIISYSKPKTMTKPPHKSLKIDKTNSFSKSSFTSNIKAEKDTQTTQPQNDPIKRQSSAKKPKHDFKLQSQRIYQKFKLSMRYLFQTQRMANIFEQLKSNDLLTADATTDLKPLADQIYANEIDQVLHEEHSPLPSSNMDNIANQHYDQVVDYLQPYTATKTPSDTANQLPEPAQKPSLLNSQLSELDRSHLSRLVDETLSHPNSNVPSPSPLNTLFQPISNQPLRQPTIIFRRPELKVHTIPTYLLLTPKPMLQSLESINIKPFYQKTDFQQLFFPKTEPLDMFKLRGGFDVTDTLNVLQKAPFRKPKSTVQKSKVEVYKYTQSKKQLSPPIASKSKPTTEISKLRSQVYIKPKVPALPPTPKDLPISNVMTYLRKQNEEAILQPISIPLPPISAPLSPITQGTDQAFKFPAVAVREISQQAIFRHDHTEVPTALPPPPPSSIDNEDLMNENTMLKARLQTLLTKNRDLMKRQREISDQTLNSQIADESESSKLRTMISDYKRDLEETKAKFNFLKLKLMEEDRVDLVEQAETHTQNILPK